MPKNEALHDLAVERTYRGETLGARLKRLRLERGRSQREIATECHRVSYAYISRVEAGARQPTTRAVRELARALGVTSEHLEFGRDVSPELKALQRRVTHLEKLLAIERRRNARLLEALGK